MTFDPTVVGSEALRSMLYRVGADVEPPLMRSLRDLGMQYMDALENTQTEAIREGINNGTIPESFKDPETGNIVSAIDALRDEVSAEKLKQYFQETNNLQAIDVIDLVQEHEETRKIVGAVNSVVDELSPEHGGKALSVRQTNDFDAASGSVAKLNSA
jgi:hypothetical protein